MFLHQNDQEDLKSQIAYLIKEKSGLVELLEENEKSNNELENALQKEISKRLSLERDLERIKIEKEASYSIIEEQESKIFALEIFNKDLKNEINMSKVIKYIIYLCINY